MKVSLLYLALLIFLVSCSDVLEDVLPSEETERLPLLVDVTPLQDQINIAKNVTIQAIFSVAMNPQSINELTFFIDNIAADISYDETSNTAILQPKSDLTFATNYRVTLKSSITSVDNRELGIDYSWNFTTNSQLSIVGTNMDITSGLGLDFLPEIRFDEAVDLNGLENHIKLMGENGSEIPINLIPSNGNTTITITPINALLSDSQYELIILDSVKDTQNTNLKNPTSIIFTTTMPPTLNLTSNESSAEYFNPSFRFDQSGNGLGVWYINDGNNIRIAASFYNAVRKKWSNFDFLDVLPSGPNWTEMNGSKYKVYIASNETGYALVWQVNNKFKSVIYKNGAWSNVSEIVSSSNSKQGIKLSASNQLFLLTWTEPAPKFQSHMYAAVFSNEWGNAQSLTDTVNGYIEPDYRISISGNSFMLVWVESTSAPKTIYVKAARFNGIWLKTAFNPINGSIVIVDLLTGNTNGEFHLFYSNSTDTTSHHHVFVLGSVIVGDHWIEKTATNLPYIYWAKILKVGSNYGLTWRDVDNSIYFALGIESKNRDVVWKTKGKIGGSVYNISPQLVEQNGSFTAFWHDFKNIFVNSVDMANPNVIDVKTLPLNYTYSILDIDLVSDNNDVGLYLKGYDVNDNQIRGQLVLFDGVNWGSVQSSTSITEEVNGFYGANGEIFIIQHTNKKFGLATFEKHTVTKNNLLKDDIKLEVLSSGVMKILYHDKNSVGNLLIWSQLHGSRRRAFANIYKNNQWIGNQLLGATNYLLSVAKNDNEFIIAFIAEDVDTTQILAKRYSNAWHDTEIIDGFGRGGYVEFNYLGLQVVSNGNGYMIAWFKSQTDPQNFTNEMIEASIYLSAKWNPIYIVGPTEAELYFKLATNQNGYAVVYNERDVFSENTNAIVYSIDTSGNITANNLLTPSLSSGNLQEILLLTHNKNYLVVDRGSSINYSVYADQWSIVGDFPGINGDSISSFNIIANNVGYMAYWTNTLNSNIDYNYFNTTWNNDYSRLGYTPIVKNQKVSLAVNSGNKFEAFLSNKISDTDATISYKTFSNPSWSDETVLHTYTGLSINEDLAIHHIKNGSNRILFWGSDVSNDYFISRQPAASDVWSSPTYVNSSGPIEYDLNTILVTDNRVHAAWIVLDDNKQTNKIVTKNGFRLPN